MNGTMTKSPFVLIVDDEWNLARNLARFFERRGYQARAVTSVKEANAIITERRPDLALIDLKLPDAHGTELCQMLYRRYRDTPLIVMSARIDESDRVLLARAGVRHYLTKPFALDELSAALETLRGASSPPATKVAAPGRFRHVASRSGGRAGKRPRVVLYSHDTMGLGHMRRNILIARSLATSHLEANVLLVSGAKEIGRFDLPPGIDCLVLPSYRKSASGDYESRHLDLQTAELMRLRAHTIHASVTMFDPDVMVVDNVPRGALGELDDTLSGLNAKGRARLVLGLRDVLDAPKVTQLEWEKRKNLNAIQWHYDEVWVYGDPNIYNLCESYDFGDNFAKKVRFTGYLDARKRAVPRADEIIAPEAEDELPDDSGYNLCLVGGGEDGFALAEAFARAKQPPGNKGLLITGPFMSTDKTRLLNQIAADKPDLQILGFVTEPTRLLANARRVVAMGGYNTVNEVLAFNRPTLIVPRIRPRLEQLIRSERLAALGHIDMLYPHALAPEAISLWLKKPDSALPKPRGAIDLGGLGRLVEFVGQLTEAGGTRHATG